MKFLRTNPQIKFNGSIAMPFVSKQSAPRREVAADLEKVNKRSI